MRPGSLIDRASLPRKFPDSLSVLFVDDDTVLRKMFVRALRRAEPNWNVSEAASGETALHLVKSENFDLIFMDQYMASIEKQLLGTDTVRALRANGVTSTICGRSANDKAQEFLDAGANTFMSKPFPCGKEGMRAAILRVLEEGEKRLSKAAITTQTEVSLDSSPEKCVIKRVNSTPPELQEMPNPWWTLPLDRPDSCIQSLSCGFMSAALDFSLKTNNSCCF